MSVDDQRTKWRIKIAENFNRLSRVHERYRQTDDRQTDGRAIAYSERECEVTFAKNRPKMSLSLQNFCHFIKLRRIEVHRPIHEDKVVFQAESGTM